MGTHTRPPAGAGEDSSLYAFIEATKAAPQPLGEMARTYEELARQAEENQPASSVLSDQMRAVANLLRKAEEAAEEWHPTARREHEADIERVENPRKGSHQIEGKADVQSAQRDM